MARFDRSAPKRLRQNAPGLRQLAHDYANRNSSGHFKASQQVDDFAFHDPDHFWTFLEWVVASDIPLAHLGDLGWGPLTWLLRRHPDEWAAKVAGFAARDARMRALVDGVDEDRVAPDVWRLLRRG